MEPLTEPEIRAAFVNCSKGEAKRLSVPRDLATRPWADLDYLGWRDPQTPDRAYLVTVPADRPVALVLRRPSAGPGPARRNLCSICLTSPEVGVSLLVAPRAGRAGRDGSSVGTYLCSDLSCSLYLRGKKDAGAGARLHETISLDEKIARTVTNLAGFLARVTA
ncbi:FBP domain-containing protein [Micromonospora radicis]|uniref:FBP domain-containing protein n=1 Tax=Micromonospora radicis TaxID=1894971 RepID=A0A418N1D3_9ACTN|nr:FBP domain-containing protein [Micromonospora radicis]RIV41358.1 FBP domain-containing protein [Micromonospora radicis]